MKMNVVQKQRKTPVSQVKSLLTRLFRSGVKGKKKLAVIGIILYIISPIDIVPDFIPMAGYADDVLLPILLIIADRLLSDEKETVIIDQEGK